MELKTTQFIPPHPLKTPVLFLIFRRLDTTMKVFESIRQAKPPRFYIASDGPREEVPGEGEKVEAVRDHVMRNIDWDCEVQTLFRDKNLGCKYAVSGAITWFFKNEEMGIILEDDCLPSQSFFWFCEELLERYKHDERIMHISGNNFQMGIRRTEHSYYYSIYNHIWGWACWKRSWRHYDDKIKKWPEIKNEGWLENILKNKGAVRYWARIFDMVYKNQIDSWAYPWTFACWLWRGLTVAPEDNLVSNIGFGVEGHHTTDPEHKCANLPAGELEFPLRHPERVASDAAADEFTQKSVFGYVTLLTEIKACIRKVLEAVLGRRFSDKLIKHIRLGRG